MRKNFTSTNEYTSVDFGFLVRRGSEHSASDLSGRYMVCGNNRNQIHICISRYDEAKCLDTNSGTICMRGYADDRVTDILNNMMETCMITGFNVVKLDGKFHPMFIVNDYGRVKAFYIDERPTSFRWGRVGVIDLDNKVQVDEMKRLTDEVKKLREELASKEKCNKSNSKGPKSPRPAEI